MYTLEVEVEAVKRKRKIENGCLISLDRFHRSQYLILIFVIYSVLRDRKFNLPPCN